MEVVRRSGRVVKGLSAGADAPLRFREARKFWTRAEVSWGGEGLERRGLVSAYLFLR